MSSIQNSAGHIVSTVYIHHYHPYYYWKLGLSQESRWQSHSLEWNWCQRCHVSSATGIFFYSFCPSQGSSSS